MTYVSNGHTTKFGRIAVQLVQTLKIQQVNDIKDIFDNTKYEFLQVSTALWAERKGKRGAQAVSSEQQTAEPLNCDITNLICHLLKRENDCKKICKRL